MSAIISKSLAPRVGAISPQNCAAAGNKTTGWIKGSLYAHFIALVQLGALGGGTVTLTFEQTKADANGDPDSGQAKAFAQTGGSSSTNDEHIEADIEPEALDQANGFLWFRAKLANVGGTGALVSAIVLGTNPRYAS